MSLKYAPKPVLVASHGLVLGGGCEFVMHGWQAQAAAETYIGLVETGVGIVPAGGGCKEMVLRAADAAEDETDLLNRLRHYFEKSATATVYTSAEQAREGGYLRASDGVTMNLARLVEDAKQACLGLVRRGAKPRSPRNDIQVAGETAYAQMMLGVHMMQRAGYASEHDAKVAGKLAYILSGGALHPAQKVSEQYLLDLEREAFLSLCGEPKTLERMQSVLTTGKPVRN
jgi:3-hydroxyacyl-CoA dehydrogenase